MVKARRIALVKKFAKGKKRSAILKVLGNESAGSVT
jgi:hypothetical protein